MKTFYIYLVAYRGMFDDSMGNIVYFDKGSLCFLYVIKFSKSYSII